MIDQIEFDLLKEDNKKLLRQLELIRQTVILKSYKLGTEFFNALVKQLNEALEADFTFIGKLCNDSDIQTLSVFSQNAIQPNFSYSLAHTPCATLIGNDSCCYSDKVTELFPDDKMLVEMGVSGYLGVSLFDSKKQAAGILVSLFKRPIKDAFFKETLLLIYASQAGGELEHLNHYRQLEESRKELELKHTELTERNMELQSLEKELWNINEQLFRSNEVLVVSEQIASTQNQRLAILFNNLPEGLMLESDKGIILRVNQKFCDFFGLNLPPAMLEEANSRQAAERISDLFMKPDTFLDRTDIILREGKSVSGEELELKDGRFFERDFFPVHLGEGQVEKLWVYRDVSARKVREKSEKRLTQRIEAALRSGNMAWWEVQFPSGKMVFDKRKAEMLGYNPGEFYSIDDFGKYIHPEDKENVDTCMEQCISGRKKIYEAEYRILNRQGNYRWFFDTGEIAEQDKKKGTALLVGLVEDITERKEAEQSLRESEERLELSIRGAGLGLWMWNMKTGSTTYNERWAELIGYSLEELSPTTIETWNQFVHPDDMAVSEEALRKHIKGESDFYECEVRMQHKDGHWVWVLDRGKVFEWDSKGNPVRMNGIQSDISARKSIETELHLTQMHYTDFINASTDLVSYWKVESGLNNKLPLDKQVEKLYRTVCLDANKALWKIVGLSSKDQIVGRQIHEFYDKPLLEDAINQFVQNGYQLVNYEIHHHIINGADFYSLASWYGIVEEEELRNVWVVSRDITQLKRAENKILENEKQLQLIFDNSPVVMLLLNEKAEIIRVNNTGKQFSGLDLDSVQHRQPGDLLSCIESIYLPEGCGTGESCKTCILRSTLLETISTGLSSTKLETSLTILKDEVSEKRDITISIVPAISEHEKTYLLTIDDITERKKAEEKLRLNEEHFRLMVENMPVLINAFDVSGNFVFWNKECESVTGYNAEEVIGSNEVLEKLYPNNDYRYQKIDQYFDDISKVKNVEIDLINKTGECRTIVWSNINKPVPLKNWAGWEVGIEITERKRALIALKKSEERYKALFLSAGDGVLLTEADKVIDCNDSSLNLLKGTREEIIGLHPWDFSPDFQPDGRSSMEATKEFIGKALMGNIQRFEFLHKDLQGGLFYADITLSAVDIEKKLFLGVLRDITDRKITEKALEESYSKFKALADYTHDWEYWMGPDDRYIYISPSCERVSGYKAEEFVNNPQLFDSIVLEEDRSDWMQHSMNPQHLPGNDNPIEFRILTRKGKIKWISHVCHQVTDANGIYRGVRATNRDITVQKLSQIALTESEMRFKQLAEISQEGIIIHKNGVLIDANKAFLALTGYKLEEILGTNFFDTFFSSQDRELAIDRTTQDYNLPWEVEIYKNNSKTFLAEILSKKISTSQPLRAVSVRDISEQKQMQQKILHAIIQTEEQERRRVAQDLHDGLGPILSTIKLLSQTYMNTQNEEFRNKLKDQLLSGIEEALDQTSSIANNLSPHVLIDFGLKVAIQKFIEKVQRINELKVVFVYDLADPIQSDVEITLYRVTIELINNTLKHSGASEMNIVYKSSGHNIYFQFSDNGSGFQFEEKRNANTSMGLFNIVNRVKSLGGTVFFENPSQGGIRYEICLPNKNTD